MVTGYNVGIRIAEIGGMLCVVPGDRPNLFLAMSRNCAVIVSILHGCVDLNLRMDSVAAESLRANSTNCSRVFKVSGLT